MSLPRWLARWNRRVTNHLTRPAARRLPGFAVVVHTGRRSGRTHRTPVNAFRRPDGVVVPLTYGADSDWVRNVVAAGGAVVETRGASIAVTEPTVVDDEGAALAPAAVRPLLRAAGVDRALLLREAGEGRADIGDPDEGSP